MGSTRILTTMGRYIVAQIFGAFIASLVVYNQWKAFLDVAEAGLAQAGALDATLFTPMGPAGAFGNYLLAPQTLPRVFMNEFVNVRRLLMCRRILERLTLPP